MAIKLFDLFKTKAAEKQLPPEAFDILLRARVLQKEGEWGQSAAAYKFVLEIDPDHWESLTSVAALALQSGDFANAVLAYSAVIERRRDHAEAYYKRGNAQSALGGLEAALADFESAISFDPQYANAFCNRGAVLERLARWVDALSSYDQALRLNPKDFLSYYNRGSVLKELQRFDEALASYEHATALRPDHAASYFNRGNVLRQLQRCEAAVASYDEAISCSHEGELLHLAYDGRGLALADLRRYDEAVASHDEAIKLNPNDYRSHSYRGLALKRLHLLEEARRSFDESITLNSNYPDGYFYRGQALQEMGQFEEAVASFDRAAALTPSNSLPYLAHSSRGFALGGLKRFDDALIAFDTAIALKNDYFDPHLGRGNVLLELRRHEAAVASYDQAIALGSDNPRALPAYAGRGFALKELKRLNEALVSYDMAISLDDNDSEVRINHAAVLQDMGRYEAAIASYDRAIELKPDQPEGHAGRGFAQLAEGRYEAALESFDQALVLKPDMKYLAAFRQFMQMQICDWRNLALFLKRLENQLIAGEAVTSPFQMLAFLDSPHLQRLAAEAWVRDECPPDDALGAIAARPRSDKIRIGYFSADFHNHAVSLLTVQLFEIHDRSRFEIVAFAFGPKVDDAVRARLIGAFDRFIEVGDQSDAQVAETARSLEIDIAVDLGGFTTHARTRIFALRAAPIQMSYIGYLGTMGAPYMDYLLADPTLIPQQESQDYSEAIIYLPSYQVNDSTRPAVERRLTRKELGLPETGFVFSCFNAAYKIMPATFAVWMRILKRVEKSSLFLYVGTETAKGNLRKEAERCGIDAGRLIFGGKLHQEDYLARLRTMDLFLDTLPYNAGTTASDALWSGLPVLTCAGRSLAGRMAASLLTAIELPELIASSHQEFEEMAVQLASNPELHQRIKRKLAQNRLTAALFDTHKFAKYLEVAYSKVYERHRAGLAPEVLYVTPDA